MFAIKAMRDRAGLTQAQTAEALGVTKKRYINWEHEEREINLRDAIRLTELFGCTLDELAGREMPKSAISLEEKQVIDLYRSTDARGKAAIAAVAASQRGADIVPEIEVGEAMIT